MLRSKGRLAQSASLYSQGHHPPAHVVLLVQYYSLADAPGMADSGCFTSVLMPAPQAAAMQWRQCSADRMSVSDGVASPLHSSWMAQADAIAAKRLGLPAQTQRPAKAPVTLPNPAVQPSEVHNAKEVQVLLTRRQCSIIMIVYSYRCCFRVLLLAHCSCYNARMRPRQVVHRAYFLSFPPFCCCMGVRAAMSVLIAFIIQLQHDARVSASSADRHDWGGSQVAHERGAGARGAGGAGRRAAQGGRAARSREGQAGRRRAGAGALSRSLSVRQA